jgi:hypothetical protein
LQIRGVVERLLDYVVGYRTVLELHLWEEEFGFVVVVEFGEVGQVTVIEDASFYGRM